MKCSVPGCKRKASFKAFLLDVYPHDMSIFCEQDITCPFLCSQHAAENEVKAQGVREPRGYVVYPYTNQESAQGFTIYEPL